jgi:hypothetical protein
MYNVQVFRRLLHHLFLIITLPWLCSCGFFSLFNSGSANVKYNVSRANLNGQLYEEKERVGDVSFSIRNIQHPRVYPKWNINVRLTPSIHYDRLSYQTGATFTNDAGVEEVYPDIRLKRGMVLADLKLTTHTPIGQFVLTGAFGGSIYTMEDGYGLDTTKTREMRKIDLAYITFLSKRVFFLIGPRYYKDENESYIFAMRIGYFWGPIKKL